MPIRLVHIDMKYSEVLFKSLWMEIFMNQNTLIHMEVFTSTLPMERYSAIQPSTKEDYSYCNGLPNQVLAVYDIGKHEPIRVPIHDRFDKSGSKGRITVQTFGYRGSSLIMLLIFVC